MTVHEFDRLVRKDRRARRRPWWREVSPIMVMLPLAAFTAVFVWPGELPRSEAVQLPAAITGPSEAELRQRRWPTSAAELDAAQPTIAGSARAAPAASADAEAARFSICGGGARVDCVVDGDTFWYGGEKIRIADINTPEVGDPGCAREAALGRAATGRLQQLLNQGPFTLGPASSGDDRDRYGRLLRTVSRGGESVGETLVREGLAEEWRGRRGSWC